MKCKLCNSTNIKIRHSSVRDRKDIKVYECNECGGVFLSSFDHISDEFYEESGMLNGHVNLKEYRQKSYKDDNRRAYYLKEKIVGKKVLDFGCGAGGFLYLIQDFVDEACGVELDRSINKTLNSHGIKCYENVECIEGTYDVITLFHVVEHLKNPQEILRNLKQFLNPNGIIIVEVPNADDALLSLYKSEDFANFTYWSCHLVLYNNYTLRRLAEKAEYQVRYIKQIQRYPLSNHLYWLSQQKPGGHSIYNFLNSKELNDAYENALASIGKCDTIIMEIY